MANRTKWICPWSRPAVITKAASNDGGKQNRTFQTSLDKVISQTFQTFRQWENRTRIHMWWDPHPIFQSIRGDHNLEQPSFLSSTTIWYHHQLFCDDYTDRRTRSVHCLDYSPKILFHSSLSVLQDLLAVRLSQHCSGAVAMSRSLVWSVEETELAFSKSSLVSRLLLVISMIPISWRKLQPKLMVSYFTYWSTAELEWDLWITK